MLIVLYCFAAYARLVVADGSTSSNIDITSRLNEICQARNLWPSEDIVGSGPAHARAFVCHLVWGHLSTEGEGKTKKQAKMR